MSTPQKNFPTPLELLQFLEATERSFKHELLEAEAEGDLVALVTAFFHFDQFCKRLDDAKKSMRNMLQGFERAAIPKAFETQGLDRIRIPEIKKSVGPQAQFSASVVDKDKLFEWLRENGQGDVIQETVNSSTLTAFVKRMIEETGSEPPTDIVETKSYERLSFVAYKPKPDAVVTMTKREADDF